MNKFAASLLGLVATVSADAAEDSRHAADLIVAQRQDVQWDRTTLVEGDFNGDGRRDSAIVGYKDADIVLAVRASSGKSRSYRTDFQTFAISPSVQAAICEKPAKLEVAEQSCKPMDEPLPGCRQSKVAKALKLGGGDCDSIHLFWSHKTNRMEWWRP